jgi:hypothetical protein
LSCDTAGIGGYDDRGKRSLMLSTGARIGLFMVVLAVCAAGLLLIQRGGFKGPHARIAALTQPEPAPDKKEKSRIGEVLTYDVFMGKMKLGSSVYRWLENNLLNGIAVNVIEVETNLVRFKDKETIYSDPQSRLPVKVTRDILNFLLRERIVEEYDQNQFTVTITKKSLGPASRVVLKKDKPIQNALLLPHYVRDLPAIEAGLTVMAHLPTRSLEIKYVSIDEIVVPAGTFKAYHFSSEPRQVDIWISVDDDRIPLKVQGLGMFNYTMMLRKYEPPPSSG